MDVEYVWNEDFALTRNRKKTHLLSKEPSSFESTSLGTLRAEPKIKRAASTSVIAEKTHAVSPHGAAQGKARKPISRALEALFKRKNKRTDSKQSDDPRDLGRRVVSP